MKVSLQSLLLAVVVIAVSLGWWIDRARLREENARLNAENAELIGRLIPSSGFAIPDGFGPGLPAADGILMNADPEDREQLLRLMDRAHQRK